MTDKRMAVVDLVSMPDRELLLEFAAAYRHAKEWGKTFDPEKNLFGEEIMRRMGSLPRDFHFIQW